MDEQRSRTGLWLWLAGSIGVTGLVVVAIFALAVAVLGASFTGCQPSAAPASPTSGPTPSAYAVQSIPPERLRLYEQAGARFDLDWSFLASIGAQECGNGECAGTNSSGCAGPMQIAYVRGSACSPSAGPTLWERYAVNADPGHPLSINDPADAIYTAARILREDMGAPPTGGSYAEYHQAACHYYGACADSTVSYADLCGHPHKSAYAESRVMPSGCWNRSRQAGVGVKSSAYSGGLIESFPFWFIQKGD